MAEERIDEAYAVTRKEAEFRDLMNWAKSGKQAGQPGDNPVIPEEQARKKWTGPDQPGVKTQDIDIMNPSIEDVLGTLLNPGEWPGLAAGGFTQAGVKGAIDWVTLGIPSLAKGLKGFGKGVVEGLGARAKEALIPASKTVPQKISGNIAAGTQPTVVKMGEKAVEGATIAPEVSAQAESVASTIQKNIDETSTKIKDLAGNWDSIKDTATRGHIGREQARTRGKELNMQIEEIKNLYPGTTMNAEQASALIDTIKPVADKAVASSQKYLKTRSPEDLHEALYNFYSLMELDPKRFGVLAESGRTLGQLNEPLSGVNQYLNQFSKIFSETVPQGLTPEYLVNLIAHLENPQQLAVMARHAARPGSVKSIGNALIEGWTMGLLSGPRTHLVNFTSNLITAIEGPVERAFAARMAWGPGEHVVKGEATEMLYQGIRGFSDALSLAHKSFKTGISQFGSEKAEFIARKSISGEALGVSGTMGRAIDWLGEITRIPGRALVAGDDLFKSLNYRMNVGGIAVRDAKAAGLEGTARSEFIESFMTHPSPKADILSSEYANYMTFTKELDGLALSISHGLENHPMLRVVLPFWRTPVNIFKFSLERTPGLNFLSGQLRKDFMAGGVRKDLALGKAAFGATLSGVVYSMARAGYFTGSGPSDKNLRDTQIQAGWRPDSVRVGNEYFGYGRVDPLSQFIGTMADLSAVSDDLDQPTIDQYAMGVVLGYMNHMTTKSYLTGITNVLEAIKQPDKRGRDYIKTWSSSLVPTIGRNVAQEIDPVRREANSIFESILAGTPYFSKSLFPKRDLKGDPIVSEGALGPDLFSFIFKSKLKDDPVWKTIYENKIAIPPVPKFMGGTHPASGTMTQDKPGYGVELNPKERDWLARMAGNELKVDGKGMWDTLTIMVKTPEFQKASGGPDGMKAKMMGDVVFGYRELAKAKLRSPDTNPELNKILNDKEIQRLMKLFPGGTP